MMVWNNNYLHMKHSFFIIASFLLIACSNQSKTILYPAPEQEKKSDDFQMSVNHKPVFIYEARVSKYPINQVWPGYQRPMDQTEIASFAYFDFKGEVVVEIISKERVKTLAIRPKEYGIQSTINSNTITFKLSKPSQFVVEINGYHKALHIFANPVEPVAIDKLDTKVHYFGPGIHEAGIIKLKSDETVYIDGGAIVYGVITSENTRNIKITGRGILDASKIARDEAPNMIFLKNVKNAIISGIILRDPHIWTILPGNCDSVTIDNVKLIGLWRYNSDGIDIVNSKNVTIKNFFVRAFDDNIAIKGLKGAYDEQHNIIENIVVDNCVLWNDWGRPIELGLETVIDNMRNITFSNCYIPHFTWIAIDIQNGDRGYVKDIRFENIFIEDPILDSITIGTTPMDKKELGKTIELIIRGFGMWATDTIQRGNINNISFNNIRYNSTNPTFINLVGYDSTHLVNNIFIKDYFVNGRKITDQSSIRKNEFVRNVFIE
jgi:polygalacturonase